MKQTVYILALTLFGMLAVVLWVCSSVCEVLLDLLGQGLDKLRAWAN